MPTAHLSPYLVFDGNCKQAMEFYHTCMGGALKLQTFGEAPMPCPDAYKDKIMHATLENDALSFMSCDTQPGNPVTIGTNVHLSVVGTDAERLKGMFEKLSAGGTVVMPLAPQFWGDTFGMLTDTFGIHWMFNIAGKKD